MGSADIDTAAKQKYEAAKRASDDPIKEMMSRTTKATAKKDTTSQI